jgi:hypothetical protein
LFRHWRCDATFVDEPLAVGYSSSEDVCCKETDDDTGDAVAVPGWVGLDAGLSVTHELLWNIDGVVLVHGVTYRSSWLLAGERAVCTSENGRRLGVKPISADGVRRNRNPGEIIGNLSRGIGQKGTKLFVEMIYTPV